MARPGWDATGLLRPLWERLEGKRDELAGLSGVRGTELSSHNNGKPLGRDVAQRIIDGFAKKNIVVSNLELGAPAEEADGPGQTFLGLLQELRSVIDKQQETIDSQGRSIRALQGRIRKIERPGESTRHVRGGG